MNIGTYGPLGQYGDSVSQADPLVISNIAPALLSEDQATIVSFSSGVGPFSATYNGVAITIETQDATSVTIAPLDLQNFGNRSLLFDVNYDLIITDSNGQTDTQPIATSTLNQFILISGAPFGSSSVLAGSNAVNGDYLYAQWVQNGNNQIIPSDGDIEGLSLPAGQTHILRVALYTNGAWTDPANQIITPALPNEAPTANAGTAATVAAGGSTLVGGADIDNDGTIVSIEWTVPDGKGVLSSTSIAQPTYTAHTPTTQEDVTLTKTVTDNDGATDVDTVVIRVQAAVIAPSSTLVIRTNDDEPTGARNILVVTGQVGSKEIVFDGAVNFVSGDVDITLVLAAGTTVEWFFIDEGASPENAGANRQETV